ncbi:hypothetical protein OKW26_001621 [Paraburkholderia sp. 32]
MLDKELLKATVKAMQNHITNLTNVTLPPSIPERCFQITSRFWASVEQMMAFMDGRFLPPSITKLCYGKSMLARIS